MCAGQGRIQDSPHEVPHHHGNMNTEKMNFSERSESTIDATLLEKRMQTRHSVDAAALNKSMGVAALCKSVGAAALCKSMGTTALYKSVGVAALYKSMGTTALYKSVGVAVLHKSIGTAALYKSIGTAALYKSTGVVALCNSMGSASLHNAMSATSVHTSMSVAVTCTSVDVTSSLAHSARRDARRCAYRRASASHAAAVRANPALLSHYPLRLQTKGAAEHAISAISRVYRRLM